MDKPTYELRPLLAEVRDGYREHARDAHVPTDR